MFVSLRRFSQVITRSNAAQVAKCEAEDFLFTSSSNSPILHEAYGCRISPPMLPEVESLQSRAPPFTLIMTLDSSDPILTYSQPLHYLDTFAQAYP